MVFLWWRFLKVSPPHCNFGIACEQTAPSAPCDLITAFIAWTRTLPCPTRWCEFYLFLFLRPSVPSGSDLGLRQCHADPQYGHGSGGCCGWRSGKNIRIKSILFNIIRIIMIILQLHYYHIIFNMSGRYLMFCEEQRATDRKSEPFF